MDARLQQLTAWLRDELKLSEFTIAPASADASFRRYFRVNHKGQTRIAMDAPPEKEDCRPFVGIARLLHELGLNVPEILEADLGQGFLLLSDLGSLPYLPALDAQSVDSLYGDALQALLKLQSCPLPASYSFPLYNEALLINEMGLFRAWYLEQHMGLHLNATQQETLQTAFEYLAQEALAQPKVCVHRDYHSRNLMVCRDNPGILDFQDAVIGPITYDLVSLLRDCYISWPRVQVEAWVRDYHRDVLQRGIIEMNDPECFLRWFDLMGVQRHLKATGIFARLNHRDGKPGYLNDIPRTLGYVREVAVRYDGLAEFAQLLESLIPVAAVRA